MKQSFEPIIDQINNLIETNEKINIIPDNVPYGCLKNGIKPSFKNWTRSNRSAPATHTTSLSFTPTIIETTLSNKPNISSSSLLTPITPLSPAIPLPVPPSLVTTPPVATTIKRHVIGKSKKSRHVGVLIKNVSTRKMIINAHKDLKKTN